MAKTQDIVVVVCGRLGSLLASHLSNEGHSVILIDEYEKKRHTRTHLAAVAPDRSILVFSTAYPGKTHDKGLLNTEGWAEWIPDDVKIQGDLGFQGLQNEYVNVEIPHKKPKGGHLAMSRKPRIKPSLESEWWVSMPLRGSNAMGLPPRSIAIEKKLR
jgi:choline dehydrogenase-like flavoprotein